MYKKVISLINIFLVIIAILISKNIINLFIEARRFYPVTVSQATISDGSPASLQEQAQPYNYYANNIIRGNLLGSSGGFLKVAKDLVKADFGALTVDLPKTSLNLFLRGTVVSGPYTSFAIIEDVASHKQGLYKIGESISGAQIIGIYRKKIILRRGGREEALFLTGEEQLSKLLRKGIEKLVELVTPQQEIVHLAPESGKQIILTKDDLAGLVDNSNKILQEVNVAPYFVAGQSSGYRVNNVKQDSILFKLGIRDEDIVTEVNGIAVNSPDSVIQAYLQAKDSSDVQVVIERGGRQEILRYQIAE